MADEKPKGYEVEQGMVQAVFKAIREQADESTYASMISDEVVRKVAVAAVTAMLNYQKGEEI